MFVSESIIFVYTQLWLIRKRTIFYEIPYHRTNRHVMLINCPYKASNEVRFTSFYNPVNFGLGLFSACWLGIWVAKFQSVFFFFCLRFWQMSPFCVTLIIYPPIFVLLIRVWIKITRFLENKLLSLLEYLLILL